VGEVDCRVGGLPITKGVPGNDHDHASYNCAQSASRTLLNEA
jgi:hypothetical protein